MLVCGSGLAQASQCPSPGQVPVRVSQSVKYWLVQGLQRVVGWAGLQGGTGWLMDPAGGQ